MSTISDGVASVPCLFLAESRLERAGGSLAHALLGVVAYDVTLRPAKMRAGTLAVRVDTLDEVLALDVLHRPAALLSLADEDVPALSMTYAVTGRTAWEPRDGQFVFTAEVTEVTS